MAGGVEVRDYPSIKKSPGRLFPLFSPMLIAAALYFVAISGVYHLTQRWRCLLSVHPPPEGGSAGGGSRGATAFGSLI